MPATIESARRYEDIVNAADPHKQFAFNTIFDQSGLLARRRSRWKFRLLQRLAPRLRTLLASNEQVRYLTRGTRYSFWETYFGGLFISFLNRRAVIVTNQRIVMFQIGSRGKPKEIVEQVRYEGIEKVERTWLGNTRIRFTNGSRITLANVPRADRNLLARLIDYTRAQLPHEDVSVEKLCCYCYQPVVAHPESCPHCHGKFLSPKRAATLSLIFPGMGDFYLGHHVFAAVEIAIAGIAWMAAIWQLQVGRGSELYFLIALGMNIGDSRLTGHVARMGLAPAARPKLTVWESVLKFASVVLVFFVAILGAIFYQINLERERFRAEEILLVQNITVATLAERIATRDTDWSVVVLYATYAPASVAMFPELAWLYQRYAGRGVAFKVFSTDGDRTAGDVPSFLDGHRLRALPPVRVLPWQRGELSAAMTRLGIDLGATWSNPLVALIDKEGRVVWQDQGVADLAPLYAALRSRIPDNAASPQQSN